MTVPLRGHTECEVSGDVKWNWPADTLSEAQRRVEAWARSAPVTVLAEGEGHR